MHPENPPIIALIDDDKIFQFTAYKILQSTNITPNILQFENAPAALQFLKDKSPEASALPDYIFLDINMPQTDGWMFLEDYEKFKDGLAKPITIYVVSSSIDPSDMKKARLNNNVKDYVVKPLTREKFIALLKHAA
jgi:two-component system, chemotaxis family, chemotaxis protein CheY